MRHTTHCFDGFTLLEILIALAIVAIGLGAAARATLQVTSGAEEMRFRTLAIWIAEDRIADHMVRGSLPSLGSAHGAVIQANMPFVWQEAVADTADPFLRRVEVSVRAASQPDYVLARLTGLVYKPARTQ